MVRKFDLVSGYMQEWPEGEWVTYEDYKDLDDDFQDYITTTDMEIEELVARLAEVNAELQKYRDQFPGYVECANCGSITHVEGVEDAMGQSGCRKEDAQECVHKWDIDGDYMMQCVRCGKIE